VVALEDQGAEETAEETPGETADETAEETAERLRDELRRVVLETGADWRRLVEWRRARRNVKLESRAFSDIPLVTASA
jgi:hypothetical protein